MSTRFMRRRSLHRAAPRGLTLFGAIAGILSVGLFTAGPAFAYWTTTDSSGSAEAAAASLAAPATFSAGTFGTTVTLSWSAPATGPAPTGYDLAGTLGGAGSSCLAAMPAATTSCTVQNLTAGSYSWTLNATINNWSGPTASASATVITLSPTTLPSAIVSAAYSQTITATGGTGPYTFGVTSGSTPTGVSLSSGGALSGTPTAAGSFTFTVTATDSASHSGFRSYTVTVALGLSPGTLPAGTVNTAYSRTITAAGGDGNYTFSVSSGTLPTGLSLSSGGVLSGTPSAAGSFTFTAMVIDTSSHSGSRSYTVAIALELTPDTLPGGTVNSPYSQTVSAVGGTSPYTFSVTGGSLPTSLNLSSGGVLSGTPSAAGAFTFTITASDSASPQNSGSQSYTVTIGLGISPILLPPATNNSPYSQQLTASGGTAPYTFTVSGGTLPTGVTLSSSGLLSGTPTQAGSFNFTASVTDSASPPNTGSRNYTLSVALGISPDTLMAGTVNKPYSQTVVASGGTVPYSYAVTGGTLPAGLNLNGSTGAITGTPTAAGSFAFTITATDSASPQNTGSQSYTVTVNLGVSPATLTNGTFGTAYSQTINAAGGNGSYTFGSTGTLPTGLSLSSSGVLSGTPTAAGTFNFTVNVSDTAGHTGSQSYTVVVFLAMSPASLGAAQVGAAYSQQITAYGGTSPYSFVESGLLPAGVTLTSGGLLSGTPTQGGSFSFSVTATDSATPTANTGSVSYSLTVTGATITVSPTTLPGGTINVAYSQAITASGGTSPYVFTKTSGTLPTNLSLSSAGVLSGTPTAAGSFTFTVTATDSSSGTGPYTGSRSYTGVTIGLQISPTSLSPADKGTAYSQTLTTTGASGAVTWTVSGGFLPTGFTLATSTGVLSAPSTFTAAPGAYGFTVTATDLAGPPHNTGSQTYTLYILDTSEAAVGSAGDNKPNVTSGSFTLSAGATYLIFAVTHDKVAGANTLSAGTTGFTSAPTLTQISTQQDYDTGVHYSAWYTSGGSGTGTVTINFTNNDHQAYVDVVQLLGANASNPINTANLGIHNATVASASATADLPLTPDPSHFEVIFSNASSATGGTAPTSSQASITLVANTYQQAGGAGTGAEIAVLSGGAQKTDTLTLGNNSGLPGTMSLEINPTAPAAPLITSANGDAERVGTAFTFPVTTTGSPYPAITETGTLPTGVTFTDNHDGTATLAGTTAITAGTSALTITATNSQGTITQNFTQNFTLAVYGTSSAATGSATTGTIETSTAIATYSPTSTYLVLGVTHDSTAGANTLSVGTSGFATAPTFTQIGSQQNYDGATPAVHYTGWVMTGGSAAANTGKVTVSFSNATHQAYVDVIQLTGADPVTPIVIANEGFANSGTTAQTTANANLPSAPNASSFEVVFLAAGGATGPGNPSSSQLTLVSGSYQQAGGTTGAGAAAFSGQAALNATITIGTAVWGTMSLEIAHQ